MSELFAKEKIVTAAGVSWGIDMALHLAQAVSGPEMAKTIQLLIEYDPKPPFDSGSSAKAEPSIVELATRSAGCVQVSSVRY